MKITDKQWSKLSRYIERQNFNKGGRPRSEERKLLDGIIWVMLSGSSWSEMPREFGSHVTAWRRFQQLEKKRVWEKIWINLIKSLDKKQSVECVTAFLSGNFVPTKGKNRKSK